MMRYLEAARLQFLQCNYEIAVLFVGKGVQTIERNRSKKIMSVRPSLASSGAVRKLAVIQARKLRITFSAAELSLFPPHHPTIILLLRLPIQLAFL